MRLNNSRISAAIAGLSLLTATLAVPTLAIASTPLQGGTAVPAQSIQPTSAKVPSGAVLGGREANGTPLYVCAAKYKNGVHPGKVVNGNCNIGYGGKEIIVRSPNYGYLVTPSGFRPLYLRYGSTAPPNSIIPYGNEANGTRLYFCRAAYNSGIHPGKVVNGNCNISFGGKEIIVRPPNYEGLVFAR